MDAKASIVALVLGVASGVVACASDDSDHDNPAPAAASSPITCDPLAPKPLTLGAVIGVGTGSDGTVYVDAANGVFVVVDGKLERQHVTGSGQGGTNEYLFTFEPPGDPSAAQTLLVETDAGGAAQAMALGAPGSRAFLDQPDSGSTPLTLTDPATVAGDPVVNTPNEISYLADVSNGDLLLATVPMNGDTASESGGLAIFYGPPDAVEERRITAFEQSLSNNGTVTFVVDSESYVLAFGTVPRADRPLGEFTLTGLTTGTGAVLDVTLRSPTPSELPSGVTFSCLR